MEKYMKPIITGFFDMDTKLSLEDQLKIANKHQIDTICLRKYENRPYIELNDQEVKKIVLELKTEKIKVAILDPMIDSYDLYDEKKHQNALEEFKYMVKMADKLKATHLYYRLPKFNNVIEEYDEIYKKIEPFIDFSMRNSKKLIFIPVNNYKVNTYAYLFKKLKVNMISYLFDPQKIMNNNESTTTAYRLLKSYIGAFRTIDANHENEPELLGYGKTDVIPIFKKLIRDRYQGFLIVDNQFHDTIFNEKPAKQSFFKKLFVNQKKKDETEKSLLSKRIFPNEEIKNVTYDDILENQIKVVRVIFK
jgi:sugar phosphate isomerase/epimerase